MRLILYTVLFALTVPICGRAQEQYYTGTITEMDIFENTGSIMLTLGHGAQTKHLLMQGLPIQQIRRYEDDILRTWAHITNLSITVISYHHTYADNGTSDGLAFDEAEIISSPGNPTKNVNHISPQLSAMLPFESCRFVGVRDRTLVWLGAPDKDYVVESGILFYSLSQGQDKVAPPNGQNSSEFH